MEYFGAEMGGLRTMIFLQNPNDNLRIVIFPQNPKHGLLKKVVRNIRSIFVMGSSTPLNLYRINLKIHPKPQKKFWI